MLSLLVAMVVCGVISVGLFLGARHASLSADGPGDPQAQPLFGPDPWQRIQLGIGQVVIPVGNKRPEPTGRDGQVNGWLGYAGSGIVAEAYTFRSPCPILRFLAESTLRRIFRPALEADGWQIIWEAGVDVDGVPGWGVVAVKESDDGPTGVLYGRYLVVRQRIAQLNVVGPQAKDDTVRGTFDQVVDSFVRSTQPENTPTDCAAV